MTLERSRARHTTRTRPPSYRQLALAAFVGCVLGAAAAALALWSGRFATATLPRPGPWPLAVAWTALPLAAFLAVLVHELGHLLAGLLAGYQPFLLIVGPFRIERSATRWHLHWNRDLLWYGGLAGAMPRGRLSSGQLTRRLAAFTAGGPLTSLLAGGLGWWVLPPVRFSTDATAAWLFAATLGQAFAFGSFLIGAITLVPGRTAGFLTDGARLRLLVRGGPAAEREAALQGILGASMAGMRPRDWPSELVARALRAEDDSAFHVFACQLAQMQAADAGDTARARHLLESVLARVDAVPALGQPAVYYDAARQLAQWGDVDRARDLVSGGGTAVGVPALHPLAELAILVAEGDWEPACTRVASSRQAIETMLDRGHAAWLGDELDALARAAQTGRQRASSQGRDTGEPSCSAQT